MKNNKNELIHWVLGFLENKQTLNAEEVTILKNKLNNSLDLNLMFDFNTNIFNNEGCKHPNNCGLPTIWHGTTSSFCLKCNYQPPSQIVSYKNNE